MANKLGYESTDANKKLSRRNVLTGIGIAGLSVISPAMQVAAQVSPAVKKNKKTLFYGYANTLEMSDDITLKEGDIAKTAGYYHIGDQGAAEYVICRQTEDLGHDAFISLTNGLVAKLLPGSSVNYRQFGTKSDGVHDDGIQIKAAHAYANKIKVPVVNTNGEFWIKGTNAIEIRTNVEWGQTVFHIDEKFNEKSNSKFNVTNDEEPVAVRFTDNQKKEFLSKFKPGVAIIEELAPYKNSLLVIADDNDRIGYRSGKAYNGKVSKRREELFYVEEHGRIIGDIAWEFNDYTDFTAYPANDGYLIIDGGTFYLSGGGSGISTNGYEKNGFQIFRSRTILRNQWVGLEKGSSDTAIIQRSGFYTFSRVYDVTLENVRLIPWEKERVGGRVKVPQGTYGIGGNLIMNATFRNVTAEGGPVHWGVFGTNLNKNFRVEECRLNRIDVHFHCWNLYISDCEIGFKGITVTGGGDLFVENTTSHSTSFINFRKDYGAKWDGDIRIQNCRLVPNSQAQTTVLSFLADNFDYRYPIGYARSIQIDGFIMDFRSVPNSKSDAWLMKTAEFSRTASGKRLFFPDKMVFRNIYVKGRSQGLRLLEVPDPKDFKLQTKGKYDGVELIPNCKIVIDDVQLADFTSAGDNGKTHVSFLPSSESDDLDEFALYPEIHFYGCRSFIGRFEQYRMKLKFENCVINRIITTEQGEFPGGIEFVACGFKPLLANEKEFPYVFPAELGVSFTNCVLYAPSIDGSPRPDLMEKIDFVRINKTVRYNHLNTRLGNDIIRYYKNKGSTFTRRFIEMLKSHHELEMENV